LEALRICYRKQEAGDLTQDDPTKSLQEIISEIKGAGDFKKSLGVFYKYMIDPAYGPQVFLNGIRNWPTEDNSLLPDAVNFGRRIASWGHADENFGNNDELRHVIGTFMLAENNGPMWAKTVTDANEVFGLVRFDIPNIGSRLSGSSQWAFEPRDLYNNLIGLMLWYAYDNRKR
jgi:hypothetical protein